MTTNEWCPEPDVRCVVTWSRYHGYEVFERADTGDPEFRWFSAEEDLIPLKWEQVLVEAHRVYRLEKIAEEPDD